MRLERGRGCVGSSVAFADPRAMVLLGDLVPCAALRHSSRYVSASQDPNSSKLHPLPSRPLSPTRILEVAITGFMEEVCDEVALVWILSGWNVALAVHVAAPALDAAVGLEAAGVVPAC